MVYKCQCPAIEAVLAEVGMDQNGNDFFKIMDMPAPVFVFENAECRASIQFKKWVKVGQPMAVYPREGLGKLLYVYDDKDVVACNPPKRPV